MSCCEGHSFHVLSTHGPLSSILIMLNKWFCVVIFVYFDLLRSFEFWFQKVSIVFLLKWMLQIQRQKLASSCLWLLKRWKEFNPTCWQRWRGGTSGLWMLWDTPSAPRPETRGLGPWRPPPRSSASLEQNHVINLQKATRVQNTLLTAAAMRKNTVITLHTSYYHERSDSRHKLTCLMLPHNSYCWFYTHTLASNDIAASQRRCLIPRLNVIYCSSKTLQKLTAFPEHLGIAYLAS